MVLRAVGIETEAEIPFSRCRPVPRRARPARVDPTATGDALAGALALRPPAPATASRLPATLSLLAAAAETAAGARAGGRPQWLDRASREALVFATRRLGERGRRVPARPTATGEPARVEAERSARARSRARLRGARMRSPRSLGRSPGRCRLLVQETGGNPLALPEVPALLTEAQLAASSRSPAAADRRRRRGLPLPGRRLGRDAVGAAGGRRGRGPGTRARPGRRPRARGRARRCTTPSPQSSRSRRLLGVPPPAGPLGRVPRRHPADAGPPTARSPRPSTRRPPPTAAPGTSPPRRSSRTRRSPGRSRRRPGRALSRSGLRRGREGRSTAPPGSPRCARPAPSASCGRPTPPRPAGASPGPATCSARPSRAPTTPGARRHPVPARPDRDVGGSAPGAVQLLAGRPSTPPRSTAAGPRACGRWPPAPRCSPATPGPVEHAERAHWLRRRAASTPSSWPGST